MSTLIPAASALPELPDQADSPPSDENSTQPSVPRLPLMAPVSILSRIYTWQPMGLRVSIKLPIVSNDKAPLFRIRVSPILYTPASALQRFKMGCSAYRNFFPLKHTFAIPGSGTVMKIEDDNPVTFTQHSPPPHISYLAAAHRFWSGGLSYMLRCTSQFTNQAQVFAAKTPATEELFANFSGQDIPGPDKCYAFSFDTVQMFRTYFQDTLQSNSFVNADLSVQRHLEITVPYEKPYPRHDVYMDDVAATNFSTTSTVGSTALNHTSWINLGLKAGIAQGSGPDEIFFELYIRAEPDFVVSDYKGYPTITTENAQSQFLSDYNMEAGKNPVIFPNSKVQNGPGSYSLLTTPAPIVPSIPPVVDTCLPS